MHDITDMADRVITIDADAFTADFHRVITARDNLIHSLSSPATPFRPAEVAELRRLTDEFATMADRIGFPQIPQNILDSFFNHVNNPEVAPPYSTGAADTPITVQPVNEPSVTAEDIFTETEGSEIQTPALPPNHFPVELSRPKEDNFNVPPPNIPLVDNILNYYNIPTHANPPLRRTFYRLWTLLTSWTFANNYLYILNCHMRFDVIPIVNVIINLTQRFRAPHEDCWVTLMIWEEIRWLHTLRGEVYAEEATRLTTAGHRQRYIELRRQLALETGMAWTHGRPVVHTASIANSLDHIRGLTYSANRHTTTDGWNMLALRQLQSEVNSLVWRHDNFHVPNANNTYQDNAVIALQSGYFIKGRDAPIPTSDHSDSVTITHLTGPDLPERMLTWEQSNFSFPGEDTVGSMGCYICGYNHFTTEHQSHTQPRRQQRQQPPPNYPDTIRASSTSLTAYERIPEQVPHAPSYAAASSSSTPTANLRLSQQTRTCPSGNNPVVYRQQMGFSPPSNQPRRNLQQRITES